MTGPEQPHTTTEVYWAPVPEALIYDTEMSDKAVRVYAALMRHGLDPSNCYPSHVRLAELIGCAQRSIQRPVRDLEAAGWIQRVPRFDDSGQRLTDGFHVRTTAHTCAGTAQERVDGPRGDARVDRAETRGEREPENESQGTKELRLSLDDARDAEPDPFDEFWRSYPRRVGKRQAMAAFERALTRASAADVIAGAVRFANDPNLPDPQFVPHPTTWLNRDGWEDEPLPPRAGTRPAPKRAPIDTNRAGPEGRIYL